MFCLKVKVRALFAHHGLSHVMHAFIRMHIEVGLDAGVVKYVHTLYLEKRVPLVRWRVYTYNLRTRVFYLHVLLRPGFALQCFHMYMQQSHCTCDSTAPTDSQQRSQDRLQ